MKNRKMLTLFMVFAALTLAGLTLLVAQGTPAIPQVVRLIRPVLSEADRLQHLYGKVVTYEDPVWVWTQELHESAKQLVPNQLTFLQPPDSASDRGPAEGLARTLEAYHQQTAGPRFKVLTSKLGLHIVPDQVRDANGVMVQAKNPLDVYVQVPIDERTPAEHFTALCAAIWTASGVRINNSMLEWPVAGPDPATNPFDVHFEGEGTPVRFAWGASGISARDAMLDLLDHAVTTFSWHTRCRQVGPQFKDRECDLSVQAVEVTFLDAEGKLKDRPILYDRCGKCPALERNSRAAPPQPKQ